MFARRRNIDIKRTRNLVLFDRVSGFEEMVIEQETWEKTSKHFKVVDNSNFIDGSPEVAG